MCTSNALIMTICSPSHWNVIAVHDSKKRVVIIVGISVYWKQMIWVVVRALLKALEIGHKRQRDPFLSKRVTVSWNIGIRHLERPRVVPLIVHGINTCATSVRFPVLHYRLRVEPLVVDHWLTATSLPRCYEGSRGLGHSGRQGVSLLHGW